MVDTENDIWVRERTPESLTRNAANEIAGLSKVRHPGLVPGIHVLYGTQRDMIDWVKTVLSMSGYERAILG